MIAPDRANLISAIQNSTLLEIQLRLIALLDEKYANPRHGHFKDWQKIYESLPRYQASHLDLDKNKIEIGQNNDISEEQKKLLTKKLKTLSPWRKGPISLFGIDIDSEWRSDWKWSRIAPHVDVQDKQVLDIGCGNGYYALRMQGMGAKLIFGIDPNWHYVFQFHAIQKYIATSQRAFVLPFTLEEFPDGSNLFDVIFSMGVLYHRQEPIIHLQQIYELLSFNGQLILETLIIEDEDEGILIPNERYANMRNVWMIPSVNVLKKWLVEAGFIDIKVVDTTMTTVNEQRQTEWMTRYSLAQALQPRNHSLTIEGYQAPIRAVLIARKAE